MGHSCEFYMPVLLLMRLYSKKPIDVFIHHNQQLRHTTREKCISVAGNMEMARLDSYDQCPVQSSPVQPSRRREGRARTQRKQRQYCADGRDGTTAGVNLESTLARDRPVARVKQKRWCTIARAVTSSICYTCGVRVFARAANMDRDAAQDP